MVWIILTFVLGWLLCGAWGKGIANSDNDLDKDIVWLYYILGPFALVIAIVVDIRNFRLWRFCKGVVKAWKEAKES